MQLTLEGALKLITRWERRRRLLTIIGFSPFLTVVSKNAQFGLCLDESVELIVGNNTEFKILFGTETHFFAVTSIDIPFEWTEFAGNVKEGIRIDFPSRNLRLFVLIQEPGKNKETADAIS
jgi:hypothetical protein